MNTPLFVSLLTLAVLLPNGYAQTSVDAPPQVEMKPVKAFLFKNGVGYLSFEGKTPKSERVELTNMPIPRFGTFWMNASLPTQILKVTSMPVKTKIKVDSGDFYEIAQANIGKVVSILRLGWNERMIDEGVIVSVSEGAKFGNPNLIGSLGTSGGNTAKMIVISSELESKHFKYSYISVDEIKTMVFKGEFLPNRPEREVEKATLYVDTKNPSEGTLSASCLVKGISWVPEYRIDLGNSGRAIFSAQALIINELMNFERVEINLVSGYPSLKFANVESPLAGTYKSLEEFLNSMDSGGSPGVSPAFRMKSNSMLAQTTSFSRSLDADGIGGSSEAGSYGAPQEAVQSAGLFFYPIKDFSSTYGSTTLVPLFGGEVTYKDLYVWDVPEQKLLQEWDRMAEQSRPSPQDTSRDIWHCIRFTNQFPLPFTKGALEFTSQVHGNIVGQGVVEFTSPGQEATVRVNKTMQVSVSREEKTISTEQKKIELTSSSKSTFFSSNASPSIFTSSTIEGTLTMKNYSNKPMMMEVTKRVQGTPLSASDKGSFSFVPGWNPMNPNGKFKWVLEVSPGETKTLTYQYVYMNK